MYLILLQRTKTSCFCFSDLTHGFPKLYFSLELLGNSWNESKLSETRMLWFSNLYHALIPRCSSLQRMLCGNTCILFSRIICLLDNYSQQLFLSTWIIFLNFIFAVWKEIINVCFEMKDSYWLHQIFIIYCIISLL